MTAHREPGLPVQKSEIIGSLTYLAHGQLQPKMYPCTHLLINGSNRFIFFQQLHCATTITSSSSSLDPGTPSLLASRSTALSRSLSSLIICTNSAEPLHPLQTSAPLHLCTFNTFTLLHHWEFELPSCPDYVSEYHVATHQIAKKYSANLREPHGNAILYLVRYLKNTRNVGIHFNPDQMQSFECYCDANFLGNWNCDLAHNDPSMAKSHSGWIIYYAGCQIFWASKLLSQVTLSTTEAEYIATMALRDVLPIMHLVHRVV